MNYIKSILLILIITVFLTSSACFAAESGLIAHYDFNAGSGDILKDESGNGLNGNILGPTWSSGALKFEKQDTLVNCGKELSAKIGSGDMTISAWIKLEANPFPDYYTNYVIFNNNTSGTGFYIRVDGFTGKVFFVCGTDYIYSKLALSNNTPYFITTTKKNNLISIYIDGVFDNSGIKEYQANTGETTISENSQSFFGFIDDLKIYNKSLTREDILSDYAQNAVSHSKDTSKLNTVKLTPLYYFDQNKIIAIVDSSRYYLTNKLALEIGSLGKPDAKSIELGDMGNSGLKEIIFGTDVLSQGKNELKIVAKQTNGDKTLASAIFNYPAVAPEVSSPKEKVADAVPAPISFVPYDIKIDNNNGGFYLSTKNQIFAFETIISYPKGGDNYFSFDNKANQESEWKIKTNKINNKTYRIWAGGKHYDVVRTIKLLKNRISVKDTIKNKSTEAIGLFYKNHILTQNNNFKRVLAGGYNNTGEQDIKVNPTIFAEQENFGIGMIALDDVYMVQAKGYNKDNKAGIGTNELAIDQNASYTLEWAIYPTNSSDYYDFINQVREDEGRNKVTIEGGFAFGSTGVIPPKDFFEKRDVKYFSLGCLTGIIDDPQIELEGIEFIEYPKLRKQIKDQFDEIYKLYPNIKCMFHIAHSIYSTNKPNERFPDSKVIDANGNHVGYASEDYYAAGASGYFSRQRINEGWRWWIYYPTLKNSFGKAMLDSVDVMVDQMHATGGFMDGFMWGYGSQYTYSEWDYHSADIDPNTKTITRKKGSVNLLSQDCLAAYVRKVNKRGGTIIANYPIFTRTIAKEKMVCDQECKVGPDSHLTHTPITLGRGSDIKNELDLYDDVRGALATGNLYFFYGEKNVTYKSVPTQMYPITIQEIHAGYVKGKERLVTMNSGVYSWKGINDIHFGYLYDARGVNIPHEFLTTVDKSGIRTQLDLNDGQTAVIKKIPISIKTSQPVNVLVNVYDAKTILLSINGNGAIIISVSNGDFKLSSIVDYKVKIGIKVQSIKLGSSKKLSFPLNIIGKTTVLISQ